MREALYIVKVGSNIIDDDDKLNSFLLSFAAMHHKKILVHGGGKLATELAEKLGVEQKLIDGRRITDAETLKVVTMVYAGYINKNIVAQLQANQCNAVGLCGADGDTILAHKRKLYPHPRPYRHGRALKGSNEIIDYGYAGDIDRVNTELLDNLLQQNFTTAIAPITHDRGGQLLNTNADTIAQEVAKAMANLYDVTLIYSFEKAGVLKDINDDTSVIRELNWNNYQELKSPLQGMGAPKIFSGMIPKLDNAFAALNSGVKKVIIGKAEQLKELINGEAGTNIVNEQ
jgi:acetylglutamate kinase